MTDAKLSDDKVQALHQRGCLNRHPERVKDALFRASDFFDPRDLVQVKYEMLRRVRREGSTVSQSAAEFGFSRPTFYEAEERFARCGLAGLIPNKPGPQGAHKLTDEILDVLVKAQAEDPSLRSEAMVELVRQYSGKKVHPRSVERAMKRRKKNA